MYKKPDESKIASAIVGSYGVMSVIAKRLKVSWITAKTWSNSNYDLKQLLQAEEEKILDKADMALYNAIDDGDIGAVKWIQSTKGKKRGYVGEKQQIEISYKVDLALEKIIKLMDKFVPIEKKQLFIDATEAVWEELGDGK